MRSRSALLALFSTTFFATTISGWHFLRFVAGICLLVVAAKLMIRVGEDLIEHRREMRYLRGDVAELIERWSFPGDSVEHVAARLRGLPYREVGDAVQIMRAEREASGSRRGTRHTYRAS